MQEFRILLKQEKSISEGHAAIFPCDEQCGAANGNCMMMTTTDGSIGI